MRHKIIYLILLTFFSLHASQRYPSPPTWSIVGAGPAGIAVVGLLIDSGVRAQDIYWIDLEFNVGRMGKHYSNVPGNATAQQYVNFLNACRAFDGVETEAVNELRQLPPTCTPPLKAIIKPLRDITHYLKAQVVAVQDQMISLSFSNNHWTIGFATKKVATDHVVLATGSHPRTCSTLSNGAHEIPLDVALDKHALAQCFAPTDTIAVVGSAHSALLIVKYLTELPVKRIINVYKHPIVYPQPTEQGVAWPESGLKGELAIWCRNVLEVNPPSNLIRVKNTPEAETWLTHCDKIIYACGFERNDLPPINGDPNLYPSYDGSNGVIGPRLFGVGIAFPEKTVDAVGNCQHLVGLPFFMPYIQRIMPEWMKRVMNRRMYAFDSLFRICIL